MNDINYILGVIHWKLFNYEVLVPNPPDDTVEDTINFTILESR